MAPPTHITLTEAADRLGVHYMTAYRYVRTGRLAATKDGHEWRVDERDVAALLRESGARDDGAARHDPDHPPRRRSRRRDYPDRLVDRLLRSDEAGAWSLIESALAGGMGPDEVYLQLVGPALHTIGAQWEQGVITVADEHRASAVVLRLIGRLGPQFARRGRKRGAVLLGTPAGDLHGIPTALFSDLLRGQGFDVVDLGPNVPVGSWSSAAARVPRLVAVGLCITTRDNDPEVRAAIAAIRAVTDRPIVVGGRAIESEHHALDLGATSHSGSFEQARSIIDQLTS